MSGAIPTQYVCYIVAFNQLAQVTLTHARQQPSHCKHLDSHPQMTFESLAKIECAQGHVSTCFLGGQRDVLPECRPNQKPCRHGMQHLHIVC